MTTRRRKQEQALFAPRLGAKPQGGHGHHELDVEPQILCRECAERDLERRRRRLPPLNHCHHQVDVDDPRQHPRRADEVMAALAIVNIALSREDATIPIPVDSPAAEEAIYDAFTVAGLTPQEARAWELKAEGYRVSEICERMDRVKAGSDAPLAPKTVEECVRLGRIKLRRWAAGR